MMGCKIVFMRFGARTFEVLLASMFKKEGNYMGNDDFFARGINLGSDANNATKV